MLNEKYTMHLTQQIHLYCITLEHLLVIQPRARLKVTTYATSIKTIDTLHISVDKLATMPIYLWRLDNLIVQTETLELL